MITYIDEQVDVAGKYVLLRADLNVPIVDGQVRDTFRLERIIETIDFLRLHKARVVIIAHCEGAESKTLLPMWKYLNGFFPVHFSETYFTPEAYHIVSELKDSDVVLFENVRINSGEKDNDPEFSKKLASLAEIYVNDAFSVSHRSHASIVGVPAFLPHYGGLLMRQEIENISKAFNPEHPFLFILGGAKFETKLSLIKKYIDRADHVLIAGALANNFFVEMGYEVGTSLVSSGDFGIRQMLEDNIQTNKLIIPTDVTVQKPDGSIVFKKSNEVLPDEYIGDVGTETIECIRKIIEQSKTIVWNGPLGNYEKGFSDKTETLAEIIADSGATSIVGGGDTLAAIAKLNNYEKFTFVSTGGGAMLDFLVNETLPGIQALEK